jgi:hypothetical protein
MRRPRIVTAAALCEGLGRRRSTATAAKARRGRETRHDVGGGKPERAVAVAQRVHYVQRRKQRRRRGVRVRVRRPPEPHHAVADELVDRPLRRRHRVARNSEEAVQHDAEEVRRRRVPERLGQRREARHVDEQDLQRRRLQVHARECPCRQKHPHDVHGHEARK